MFGKEKTVRVKLKVGRVGIGENGIPWAQSPGDIVTVGEAEAGRMVQAGQCELAPGVVLRQPVSLPGTINGGERTVTHYAKGETINVGQREADEMVAAGIATLAK